MTAWAASKLHRWHRRTSPRSRDRIKPNNLVVRFGDDALDQSPDLLKALQSQDQDASEFLQMSGDHLTPASAGLRQGLLGDWADDPAKKKRIRRLTDALVARI